jgi:hypothetical protein
MDGLADHAVALAGGGGSSAKLRSNVLHNIMDKLLAEFS